MPSESATTDLVTAAEAARRIPGVTMHRVIRWREMGLLEAQERADGPSLYSFAAILRLASQPPEVNLRRARHGVALCRPRPARLPRCCTVCGRDTRRMDGICRHCIGEFDHAA